MSMQILHNVLLTYQIHCIVKIYQNQHILEVSFWHKVLDKYIRAVLKVNTYHRVKKVIKHENFSLYIISHL